MRRATLAVGWAIATRGAVQAVLIGTFCVAALAADAPEWPPWTLGPGDAIRVQIWNHNTDVTVTVTPQGTVVLPLVGKVPVKGLSEKAAEEAIAKRYADGFFKNPQVVLTIQTYVSHKVSVFGAARTVGDVPLVGPMTLAELYNKVGGHAEGSDGRVVVRRRKSGPGGVRLKTVSIQSLLSGNPTADIPLHDGDRVFFPSRANEYFEVHGAVRKPGRYPLYSGMKVLSAISAAGGLAKGASGRVRMFRRSEMTGVATRVGGREESDADEQPVVAKIYDLENIQKKKQEDIALRSGDYLIVESGETAMEGIWILGAVKEAGFHAWPKNKVLTVRKALTLAGGASPIASFWRIKIDREIKGQHVRMRAKLDTVVKPGDTIVVPESWI